MTETIEVACQHCGEPIPFAVEDGADPPQQAFCEEDGHAEHPAPTPEATA
jgi:hypothetical protein